MPRPISYTRIVPSSGAHLWIHQILLPPVDHICSFSELIGSTARTRRQTQIHTLAASMSEKTILLLVEAAHENDKDTDNFLVTK
jgi:hypothetical protein